MLLSFRLLACIFLASSGLQAQTHLWTGNAGDNNWFTASNWNTGTIPDITSDVLLGANATVEIPSAASAATITIAAEANLILQANLLIDDTMTVNDAGVLTWQKGSISEGTMINNGFMFLEGLDDKILDGIEFINNKELVMQNANNVRLLNSVEIFNSDQAIFSVASNGAISSQDTSTHLFVNEGLLEKVSSNNEDPGICYLIFDIENRGVLKTMPNQTFLILGGSFNFTNFEEGRIEGFGILDITSNFNNLGTYDPGNETNVGTIAITNNFATSAASTMVIDIEGVQPGQYDTYDNVGFPNLSGNLEINIDFVPSINDEFTIVTALDINECNFPSQVTSINGGVIFDVICNQTSVVLRVAETILSVEDANSESFEFKLSPNPVDDVTRFHFSSEESLSLHIYNLSGQLVDTVENAVDGMSYNRNGLSSGLYFARLESEQKVFAIAKMVVK